MELLKLVALDGDDLAVVSTHLQDAIGSIGDVHWRPKEKRLLIALARFDWEGSLNDNPQFKRRKAALRFERVNSIKCRNLDCTDKVAKLNLLAIEFDEVDPPSGVVTLTFSAAARCGSRSNAWNANSSISGRCGRRRAARSMSMGLPRK